MAIAFSLGANDDPFNDRATSVFKTGKTQAAFWASFRANGGAFISGIFGQTINGLSVIGNEGIEGKASSRKALDPTAKENLCRP